MTYKELLDQLSKLTEEELEQRVLLYDTAYSAKTYSANELVIPREEAENVPSPTRPRIKDSVLITF